MVHCHTTCSHNQDIHSHNTQSCKKNHQLKTNREYGKNCIRNSLSKIVNDAPKLQKNVLELLP